MFGRKKSAADTKILFLGDSITDVNFNKRFRVSIGGADCYPLQTSVMLRKKFGERFEFFYKGIASNRSYHVYDRLTPDCINLKPDIIVLFIGVNDAWENYVPEEYPPLLRPFEPHMAEIFRRIETELPDAKLIVMLPFITSTIAEKQPFHEVLEDFRARLLKMAQSAKVSKIIDLQQAFDEAEKKLSPHSLSRDSVHPTNVGHKVIAEELFPVISELIEAKE